MFEQLNICKNAGSVIIIEPVFLNLKLEFYHRLQQKIIDNSYIFYF